MEITATKYSAILKFHNIAPDATPTEIADWMWSSVGLCLQESDIELSPTDNGALTALVRVPRKSLADFLDRAVADLSFKGRRVCVRAKRRECPRPDEGREGE